MMKKSEQRGFVGALIAFLLLLTMACSKESSKPPAKPQTTKDQIVSSPSAPPLSSGGNDTSSGQEESAEGNLIARKWTGDLDGMIQRRQIRVLTINSKTNFFIDKGTQRGLTYEAFRLFEEDLNKQLKNKNIRVHVVFKPVAHDDLIPALLDGRGDIVSAGTLITESRLDQVDFTNPTRSNVSSIVVTGPGVPPVNGVKDLAGKEVYLRLSAVSTKGVEKFNAMLAKDGLPPVKVIAAPEVLADEDILEMVNAGLVKITVAHDYVADFWKQIFPNIVLHKDVAVKSDGQIAMMVRKNSPQLMAELNAFIARYPEGSMQRNVLFRKYLKDSKYAKQATSKQEMAKFQKITEFMRKYSDQYGLDYLLMGAQGYQESGLDQNRKSPVGAIGVMQVMPATGKDLKVGDITELEPNVHAGVKYIRFMMDQYYAKEPMDTLNKGLFTFASYNAGPGRIKQLRERAAQRGLDPNKWFNNVEVIASESIGRETVQYVSNIYKYYLAYKMVAEQAEQQKKARQEVMGKK
jgi:membrane-bound lytic murein transglycosylase MltF